MNFSYSFLSSFKLVVLSTFLFLAAPNAQSQIIIDIFDIPGFANGGGGSTDFRLISNSAATNPIYHNANGYAESDPVTVQIYDNNNNLVQTISYASPNEMIMPQLSSGLYRFVIFHEGTSYAKWVQIT